MQIFVCLGGFLSLLASLYVRVTAPTNLVPRSYRETKIYTIFFNREGLGTNFRYIHINR